MAKPWLCVVLGLVACSSNDETIQQRYAFEDAAGRSCQATLEKTRPGSPSVGQSVSCEDESKTCTGGARPCFVLSVESKSDALRNCPACCQGASSSFVGADCAGLICESDADCVYAEARCEGGLCLCAGGYCQ